MSLSHLRAPLVAAAFACLFASSATAQTPAKPAAKPAAKAAPATGPWAKVPALSTACYSGADPFNGKLSAAIESANADIERQKAVNARIEEDFRNIDPMEKAQRMQQWMMSNPQEAMKYAQAQQAIGQAAQEQLGGQLADEQAFNEERQGLPAKYQAALKQAHAPAEARWAALNKKVSDAGQCEGMHEGCRMTAADNAEWDAIDRQRDEAYRANCARYFGATGEVTAYLKRYRDWLVTKRTPFDLKGDEARLAQYAIMNTPAASWKSTVAAEHAVDYMQAAESLYGLRDAEPHCTAAGCKR